METSMTEQVALAPLGGDRRGDQRAAEPGRTRGDGAPHRRAGPTPIPTGPDRRYSRGTIDRWIRAWRTGGLTALTPHAASRHRGGAGPSRSCSPRRQHCAWSCRARSAAQIA